MAVERKQDSVKEIRKKKEAAAGFASCFTWHPGWNFSLSGDMWNGWFRSTSS